MNPKEALDILDSASSSIQANRASHIKIQQAVDVLKELIKNDKREDKKTK